MTQLDPAQCVKVANIGDDLWVVTEDYAYATKSGLQLVVPAGFETDGASVPRCLWAAIPPSGLHFNAAVVHDALYRTTAENKLPKSQCDDIFLEIMQRDQVPEERALAMVTAVRLLGYSSYHRGKTAAAQSLLEEHGEGDPQ